MEMHRTRLAIVLCLTGLVAATGHAQKRTTYKWVDDNGVVHFGDHIPPEYAHQDRDVLNAHGVAVRHQEGEVSAEEKAAAERHAKAEAEKREAQEETARRDRMLLETYLSVQDIETLRDERLQLLEAQINVTEIYLNGLRQNLDKLSSEASRYKPLNERENAREMPEDLVTDISRTEASIELYEDTLVRAREEMTRVRESFDADIARFRELKQGG